jgi:hypothetical protein
MVPLPSPAGPNACGTAGHPGGTRPAWLWPGYHCTFDKDLRRDYGISCADYWRLFDFQGGRCARCRRVPGARRLVVDEDDTDPARVEIRGLVHKGCNFKVDRATAAYVKDPPGPKVGPFPVSADRARRRRRRLEAKRKAATPAANTGPKEAGGGNGNSDYANKVRAAQEALRR